MFRAICVNTLDKWLDRTCVPKEWNSRFTIWNRVWCCQQKSLGLWFSKGDCMSCRRWEWQCFLWANGERGSQVCVLSGLVDGKAVRLHAELHRNTGLQHCVNLNSTVYTLVLVILYILSTPTTIQRVFIPKTMLSEFGNTYIYSIPEDR